jgi:hypothetical protein
VDVKACTGLKGQELWTVVQCCQNCFQSFTYQFLQWHKLLHLQPQHHDALCVYSLKVLHATYFDVPHKP